MSAKHTIKDGRGTGSEAFVNEGAQVVEARNYPDLNPPLESIVFRKFLSTEAGVTDARVDGSSTPVKFSVSSDPDKETFITRLTFTISDQSATLSQFGAIGILANGFDLYYESPRFGRVDVSLGMKTNYSFIRLCGGKPAFGDGATAFRANNVSGNSEGYLCILDWDEVFGIQSGVRLRAGQEDRIVLQVNDNVVAVDQFDVIAYGFQLSRS